MLILKKFSVRFSPVWRLRELCAFSRKMCGDKTERPLFAGKNGRS